MCYYNNRTNKGDDDTLSRYYLGRLENGYTFAVEIHGASDETIGKEFSNALIYAYVKKHSSKKLMKKTETSAELISDYLDSVNLQHKLTVFKQIKRRKEIVKVYGEN